MLQLRAYVYYFLSVHALLEASQFRAVSKIRFSQSNRSVKQGPGRGLIFALFLGLPVAQKFH